MEPRTNGKSSGKATLPLPRRKLEDKKFKSLRRPRLGHGLTPLNGLSNPRTEGSKTVRTAQKVHHFVPMGSPTVISVPETDLALDPDATVSFGQVVSLDDDDEHDNDDDPHSVSFKVSQYSVLAGAKTSLQLAAVSLKCESGKVSVSNASRTTSLSFLLSDIRNVSLSEVAENSFDATFYLLSKKNGRIRDGPMQFRGLRVVTERFQTRAAARDKQFKLRTILNSADCKVERKGASERSAARMNATSPGDFYGNSSSSPVSAKKKKRNNYEDKTFSFHTGAIAPRARTRRSHVDYHSSLGADDDDNNELFLGLDLISRDGPQEENIPLGEQIVYRPELNYKVDERKTLVVRNNDFRCLYNGNWVNDAIVDFFLNYTFLREKGVPSAPINHYKVEILNTFFYSQLTKGSPEPNMCYQNVKSWFKNNNTLFENDFVVIPIMANLHWFAVVVTNLPEVIKRHTVVEVKDKEEVKKEEVKKEDVKKEVEEEVKEVKEDKKDKKEEVKEDNSEKEAKDEKEEKEKEEKEKEEKEEKEIKEVQTNNSDIVIIEKESSLLPETDSSFSAEPTKLVRICMLDSLRKSHHNIGPYLKQFFMGYAKDKYDFDVEVTELKNRNVAVPQQKNFNDCGLHVIYNLEVFFRDPDLFQKKVLNGKNRLDRDVFKAEERKNLRSKLRGTLIDLLKQQVEKEGGDTSKIGKETYKEVEEKEGSVDAVPKGADDEDEFDDDFMIIEEKTKVPEPAPEVDEVVVEEHKDDSIVGEEVIVGDSDEYEEEEEETKKKKRRRKKRKTEIERSPTKSVVLKLSSEKLRGLSSSDQLSQSSYHGGEDEEDSTAGKDSLTSSRTLSTPGSDNDSDIEEVVSTEKSKKSEKSAKSIKSKTTKSEKSPASPSVVISSSPEETKPKKKSRRLVRGTAKKASAQDSSDSDVQITLSRDRSSDKVQKNGSIEDLLKGRSWKRRRSVAAKSVYNDADVEEAVESEMQLTSGHSTIPNSTSDLYDIPSKFSSGELSSLPKDIEEISPIDFSTGSSSRSASRSGRRLRRSNKSDGSEVIDLEEAQNSARSARIPRLPPSSPQSPPIEEDRHPRRLDFNSSKKTVEKVAEAAGDESLSNLGISARLRRSDVVDLTDSDAALSDEESPSHSGSEKPAVQETEPGEETSPEFEHIGVSESVAISSTSTDSEEVVEEVHISSGNEEERPIKASSKPRKTSAKAKTSFACTQCRVNFEDEAQFHAHLFTHSTEHPFLCPCGDCKHSFKRSDSLRRHMRNKHPERFPPSSGGRNTSPKEYLYAIDLARVKRKEILDKLIAEYGYIGESEGLEDIMGSQNAESRPNSIDEISSSEVSDEISVEVFPSKDSKNHSDDEVELKSEVVTIPDGEQSLEEVSEQKAVKRAAQRTLNPPKAKRVPRKRKPEVVLVAVEEYACQKCDYSCTRRPAMSRHLRRHDDAKPYQCPLCVRNFKKEVELRSHMTSTHQEMIASGVSDPAELENAVKKGIDKEDGILSRVIEEGGVTVGMKEVDESTLKASGAKLVHKKEPEKKQNVQGTTREIIIEVSETEPEEQKSGVVNLSDEENRAEHGGHNLRQRERKDYNTSDSEQSSPVKRPKRGEKKRQPRAVEEESADSGELSSSPSPRNTGRGRKRKASSERSKSARSKRTKSGPSLSFKGAATSSVNVTPVKLTDKNDFLIRGSAAKKLNIQGKSQP